MTNSSNSEKVVISDRELQKAKNIRLAEFYREMKTISGKADVIGSTPTRSWQTTGRVFSAAAAYEKVSKRGRSTGGRQVL